MLSIKGIYDKDYWNNKKPRELIHCIDESQLLYVYIPKEHDNQSVCELEFHMIREHAITITFKSKNIRTRTISKLEEFLPNFCMLKDSSGNAFYINPFLLSSFQTFISDSFDIETFKLILTFDSYDVEEYGTYAKTIYVDYKTYSSMKKAYYNIIDCLKA